MGKQPVTIDARKPSAIAAAAFCARYSVPFRIVDGSKLHPDFTSTATGSTYGKGGR